MLGAVFARLVELAAERRYVKGGALHVRDDVQLRELGRGLLAGGSTSKAALDTSVLPGRNA